MILKPETINDLKYTFDTTTELNEFIPELSPSVEVTAESVIININERVHPENVKNAIFEILRNNDEAGPLNIHVETATSCKLTFYAEITKI